MRTDLLLTLAKFLRNLPPSRFDIQRWRCRGAGENSKFVEDADLETDCGTRACAIGWACTIPEFKELGLDFKPWTDGLDDGESAMFGEPHFNHSFGFEASALFFGISFGDAIELFSDESYPSGVDATPSEVADKIEIFVGDAQ